jgi:hypothetical protein
MRTLEGGSTDVQWVIKVEIIEWVFCLFVELIWFRMKELSMAKSDKMLT